MAQAVKELFPTAQLTIGPAIEEGFYYDFAFERPFTPEDLEKIEARDSGDHQARSAVQAHGDVPSKKPSNSSKTRGEALQGAK